MDYALWTMDYKLTSQILPDSERDLHFCIFAFLQWTKLCTMDYDYGL